jgi:tryptophan halogenase
MEIPDSLARRMALFASKGRIFRQQEELFSDDSWLAVLLGQGIVPSGYDPLVDGLSLEDIRRNLAGLRSVIAKTAQSLPTHSAFIDRACKAELRMGAEAPLALSGVSS